MDRMSFGNYTFPYNPESLKISRSRRTVTRFSPLCGSFVEDYGAKPIRVSGEGEFFGASAESALKELIREFEAEERHTLTVGGETFPACFESLTVVRNAETQAIRFLFEFIETETL